MRVRTFSFNKLFRDKIYHAMINKGVKIDLIKINTKEELIKCFKDKLLEESQEVSEAKDKKELLEELADCVEVINGFVKALKISKSEFEKIRKEKYDVKGGFDNQIMVGNISVFDNDPDYYKSFVEYCERSPKKYPEIIKSTKKKKAIC